MNILDVDCPLFSKELLAPWRLVSLMGGLAVLVLGSVMLPSDDWDVPISTTGTTTTTTTGRATPARRPW